MKMRPNRLYKFKYRSVRSVYNVKDTNSNSSTEMHIPEMCSWNSIMTVSILYIIFTLRAPHVAQNMCRCVRVWATVSKPTVNIQHHRPFSLRSGLWLWCTFYYDCFNFALDARFSTTTGDADGVMRGRGGGGGGQGAGPTGGRESGACKYI